MRKTLYLKFLLAYLIFGFFGFMVVATFVNNMTMEHLKREKADALYKEATLIANTYASDLYNIPGHSEKADRCSGYVSGSKALDHQSIRTYGSGFTYTGRCGKRDCDHWV